MSLFDDVEFMPNSASIFDKFRQMRATETQIKVNTNICESCNAPLTVDISENNSICIECGKKSDLVDESIKKFGSYQTRITGPGSLQKVLSKTAAPEESLHKKNTFEEFKEYNRLYQANGGRNIPESICECAANYYSQIQQEFVRRAENKKEIMAACLYYAAIHNGIFIKPNILAKFMELDSKGITAGINAIINMKTSSSGRINIDIETDPTTPIINTVFSYFEYTDTKNISNAIIEMLTHMQKLKICADSFLISKLNGIIFTLFKRSGEKYTIDEYSDKLDANCVKDNTMLKIIRAIIDYHSQFVPIYQKYNLNTNKAILNKKNFII